MNKMRKFKDCSAHSIYIFIHFKDTRFQLYLLEQLDKDLFTTKTNSYI